jgi:glycosyltransferase involved in cell wall biosynthesis
LLKILVVHEVSYLSKIIYEFQILPEFLSMLGHEVTSVDYDDAWQSANGDRATLRTSVHKDVHRAYPRASVTVRRPGMIRAPVLSRISGAAAAGVEVVRTIRRERPDIVLLYGLPTVGVQSILAARACGVPIAFRSIDVTHELVPYPSLVPLTRILERIVFNQVDLNIALTPHLKSYILGYGVPESRIRLLPSGVDAEMFSPGERNPNLLRAWGISSEDRVVLFMGTIYRFSGLDRVIRDFPVLLSRVPQAKLLILGVGEDEARLKEIAARAGVGGNVIFAGMQPYAALPDAIRSADVCINPFELNGVTRNILPTKLFQYMACSRPVLATPLPGSLPFLPGEQQGIVYSGLDDFNQSLGDLLCDRERCAQLGRRGHAAAQAYDWRAIAESMAGLLKDLAA